MYAEHQPLLSKLGRSGPDGWARIATFAMLTIRVHLHDAVRDFPYVIRGELGRAYRSVWGWKHFGLADIVEKKADYYELCERQFQDTEGEELEDGLLHTLTSIPGIGCAKGGFIAQMIYGVSGCLDGHNLKRFEIPYGRYKVAGTSCRRRSTLITEYNEVCRKLGGPQSLWDSWCCYVADRDANYVDADHVSRLHLTPLP